MRRSSCPTPPLAAPASFSEPEGQLERCHRCRLGTPLPADKFAAGSARRLGDYHHNLPTEQTRGAAHPSKLKSSLKNVAEDARRFATSLGELSGRAQLIINLVREKQTVEHLWLLEAVAGTGEFRPFDPGLNSEEFISSKGSGFLSEILDTASRAD